MSFIQPAYFVDPYEISKHSTNVSHIQSVIAEWEDYYMSQLFGVEMYAEYVDGLLLPDPDNEIWKKLRDPFIVQLHCGIIQSKGIKEMLLGFIYWHYFQTDSIKANITGQVAELAENSVSVDPTTKNATLFNKSVSTFQSIQQYVRNNPIDYPNYAGHENKYFINPFF